MLREWHAFLDEDPLRDQHEARRSALRLLVVSNASVFKSSERWSIVWSVCRDNERAAEPDRQVLEDMDIKWPTAESLQMAWVDHDHARRRGGAKEGFFGVNMNSSWRCRSSAKPRERKRTEASTCDMLRKPARYPTNKQVAGLAYAFSAAQVRAW